MRYYHLYDGHWDHDLFEQIVMETGYSAKQINKYFWDRKRKEQHNLEAKKFSYPGLIFQITDCRTGKDLTPSFAKMASCRPLFRVE